MRRTARLLYAALLAALAVQRAEAQPDDTLKALLHFRECPLDAELEAVYERPATADDRFLRVRVTERPAAVVQCMVADGAVICEASAFYGGTELHKEPLPPQSAAALQSLGFTATADGWNFQYRRAFTGEPDFDAIAVLMLTALHDAYGVRADTELDTYAPFVGDMVVACRR